MKKAISLVLVLTLGLTSSSYSAEGIWTTKADMPTGRWELSTCVVDGKIYAIGGAGPVYQALGTVEVYDPATDTWTAKSQMPTARQGLTTSVVNGKIYAIGGGVSSSSSYSSVRTLSTVEEYDPTTDAWITKSPMPTARGWHSSNVLDGRIYVIGGSSADPSGGKAILAVEVYDPVTDTWTQKGNIPRRIGAGWTSVVCKKIYAFGGYGGLNNVHEYDPVTDTWTNKANMPTRRCGLSTSVIDRKIYAIGGHSGSSPYRGLATVEVYDPATDTWTTAPDMLTGRCGVRTSVVGGKIYAFGGYMGTWLSPMCVTVEEYDTGLNVSVSPPDFNGDGKVDIEDLIILIESWNQDDPICDIVPWPFGDCIVDTLDLELLMSYWEQTVDDPSFAAHWALDEVEGDIAYDSASLNDALIIGDPVWQPDSGQVNGALQLDGIDDYIITGAPLNPSDGPFSVLVWIIGGAPGQVVISQQGAANWLKADSEGNLMTELKGTARSAIHLQSQTNIIDGYWHHICFVWDGANRILYVDGVAVAQNTQQDLGGSEGDLYIGCGKDMEAGTYFSGLIDDVRIYNRAVRP